MVSISKSMENLTSRSCLLLIISFLLFTNSSQGASDDEQYDVFGDPPENPDKYKYRIISEIKPYEVRKWAQKFGDELWELGKRMTKSPEIRSKYKEYNARVEEKDGHELLKYITENVGRMLSRKMDAIICIQEKAEELAENFEYNETIALNEFQYYSSKYSMFEGERTTELVETLWDQEYMYLNMTLNPDTHFYNISVNTEYSAVHVPSNVYDRSPKVLQAIVWSQALDEIFVQNYQQDPALSWQYFGSDTGFLRHYPALQWYTGNETDTYDCRKRSWYIETATCSKDIVILLDNSGSMYGYRKHVAKFTIRSILDTFSNNDFFTILRYSADVDEIVDCFKDILVQATPENIDVFTDAVANSPQPEGHANLTKAYIRAFELLKTYYINRRCNETKTGCNQAIMLVTDGVAGNTTNVFEKYNWGIGENSTQMKVRVFTYLLGKEVTKVREIQWMACQNRGYYSHVRSLDEVSEDVLKYVDVIATPLVLQNELHPPTWTHAFADKAHQEEDSRGTPRLMIAVGIPAFDRAYLQENSTRRARLLGVAGTDIPLEDIDKLTLPYKLGVNGYSFIVSNNGYVVLHPDLRPVGLNGTLKRNYNSIDLTEIEQLADDLEPRQPGELMLELRSKMVSHESGVFENVTVKFHYDDMRRISIENQTYFFAPLPKTPFSLGIALPSTYGMTWIKVGDEVKRNVHLKVNISHYFIGENWKVQPDWVYCKYHYLEGHEFKTPEEELRHFLLKMTQPDWKWSDQYEFDPISDADLYDKPNCRRPTLNNEAYYCNKELVQLLIFDAKVTNTSYGTWKFADEYERDLINKYNATVRFVGTMSGLTRWQFIFGEIEIEEDQEFGDYHAKAIDEAWYRNAILQHAIDPDSFVYSVPHPGEAPKDEELKVTASHAIFPRDGGKEAPGCVVGFQFSHSLMKKRFFDITSVPNCTNCVEACWKDDVECYVIDNNGYIIIADKDELTGRFFGEINGDVMREMVDRNIFQRITVYDYQGLCYNRIETVGAANRMLNPIQLLGFIFNWIFTEIIWYMGQLSLWVEGTPFYEMEDDYPDDPHIKVVTQRPPRMEIDDEEAHWKAAPKIVIEEKYYACDKQSELYVLNQDMFIKGNDFNEAVVTVCSHPFHVKRIPKSNLLLIVIKAKGAACENKHYYSSSPMEIVYNAQFPCHKINLTFLERRRLEECFTEHEQEEEFTYCGDASMIQLGFTLFILSAMISSFSGYFYY